MSRTSLLWAVVLLGSLSVLAGMASDADHPEERRPQITAGPAIPAHPARTFGPAGRVGLTAGLESTAASDPAAGEFLVNTYTTGNQWVSAVARDGFGGFVVTWQSQEQDGSAGGIFGQRFDSAGLAVGTEFQINTHTTGKQNLPAIAIDDAGAFVVTWEKRDTDWEVDVSAQLFDAAGVAAGGEMPINTFTVGPQQRPAVARSRVTGDFVVIWDSYGQEGPGYGYGVFGQRFDSAGVAQGGEFQVNTYTTGNQFFPAVAMDDAGDFVVVWSSPQDGSSYGVFGQRFQFNGATDGSEFQVNDFTVASQQVPQVSMDPAGSFVVVWHGTGMEGMYTGYGVFAKRFDPAGLPAGGDFLVNTFTPSLQVYGQVSMDTNGSFVVVWDSYYQDGSAWGTFGQRFDATGASLGSEFQVNTFTTDSQLGANAAAGTTGFVVTWESRQDGSGHAVLGKLCGVDVDGDGLEDCSEDGCVDPDGDGYGWSGLGAMSTCLGDDCAEGNNQLWSVPGEVPNVLATFQTGTGTLTLAWDLPLEPGGVAEPLYDTVRSDTPVDFHSPGAMCIESNDGSDRTAVDVPTTDSYYLVRAENACGMGTAGATSVGVPRDATECP
jgi:hypothetical protein